MSAIKLIPIANTDKFVIVDADLYESLTRVSWFLETTGYARANFKIGDKWKRVSIHRHILKPPSSSTHIDHLNGDKLDNRRANLRLCTQGENNKNLRPRNKDGVKGIHKTRYGYAAQITANGKKYYLGTFKTAHEAGAAYDKAAKKYHGEFAYLNFPEKFEEN